MFFYILACSCIEGVSSLRRLLGEPVDRGFSLYGVVIKQASDLDTDTPFSARAKVLSITGAGLDDSPTEDNMFSDKELKATTDFIIKKKKDVLNSKEGSDLDYLRDLQTLTILENAVNKEMDEVKP